MPVAVGAVRDRGCVILGLHEGELSAEHAWPQMLRCSETATGECCEADAQMCFVWSEPFRNTAVTLTSSLLSWDIQYDLERRLTPRICGSHSLCFSSRDDRVMFVCIGTARQIQLNDCWTSLPSWRIEHRKRVYLSHFLPSVSPLPFYLIRSRKKQLWELH